MFIAMTTIFMPRSIWRWLEILYIVVFVESRFMKFGEGLILEENFPIALSTVASKRPNTKYQIKLCNDSIAYIIKCNSSIAQL